MVKIEINVTQIKKAIEQLSDRERTLLLKELNRKAWAKRLNQIFPAIDQRRKKAKISFKEIDEEIRKARQEFQAHRR